jgi:hypothetical protein
LVVVEAVVVILFLFLFIFNLLANLFSTLRSNDLDVRFLQVRRKLTGSSLIAPLRNLWLQVNHSNPLGKVHLLLLENSRFSHSLIAHLSFKHVIEDLGNKREQIVTMACFENLNQSDQDTRLVVQLFLLICLRSEQDGQLFEQGGGLT